MLPSNRRRARLASVSLILLGTAAAMHGATAARATTAARPFDTSLPRPFLMSMRGANAAEAWVTMAGRAIRSPIDEAIVDVSTGCVVETMPRFSRLAQLDATRPDAFAHGPAADVTRAAEALIADPSTTAEIVRFVRAGRRFGRNQLGFGAIGTDDVAFSGDGRTIALEAAEAVFRSNDGGQTFDRLDRNMSRFPAVTRDGTWVLYERCADASRRNQACPDASREVRIVAADNSVAPRTIALGSGLLRGLDASGQKLVAVFSDRGNEVTAMHIDPASGTMTRAFGIPSTVVKRNRFHDLDVSGGGSFGVFDDNDAPPANVLTVVSMVDGSPTQELTVTNEMGTETDDESGRIMWQTFPDDHAWARTPGGSTEDLGMGDPLGWAPGGHALVFEAAYAEGRRSKDRPATVAALACKLVRVTTVR